VVSVRLRDGRSIRGLAKNESNFDLQLQGLDGRLYLLRRDEIAGEEREQKSLMPPVEASQQEMRNLLSYLSRLTGTEAKPSEASEQLGGGVPFADLVDPKRGECRPTMAA